MKIVPPKKKPPENVSRVPTSQPPDLHAAERRVQIGYRPLGWRAAAWTIGVLNSFCANNDKNDAEKGDRLPDPHYHWCVLVEDYYHQMQISRGIIWYENNQTSPEDGWSVYEVGVTKCNDAAIADAAAKTVMGMPQAYDLMNNNCHHFVYKLLDRICTNNDHWQKLSTHRRYCRRRRRKSSVGSSSSSGSALARLFAAEGGGGPLHNHAVVVATDDQEPAGHKPRALTAAVAEHIMAKHTPRVTPGELQTVHAQQQAAAAAADAAGKEDGGGG